MDRKYSNLGKPPPKLRYFKTTDRSYSNKVRTVVRNIEDCFDKLDSSPNTASELSLLSPLPKTWTLSEDVELMPSPILQPVMGSSEKLLCNEERISSRAGLVADEDDGDGDGDDRPHRASPLLFFNEDEGPKTDAIKTVQSNKKSQMARKYFEESSEDELESPPKRFVLGKSLKASTGSKGLEQREASCSFSSDEEFLSLQSKKVDEVPCVPSLKSRASDKITRTAPKIYEGKPSTPPEKLNIHPHPLEKNHKNTVGSGVKPLKEGRKSSAFLLKLKDTGRTETMRFRTETSPIQVSQHLEAVEDFMILEDENLRNPCWFSIPRKTEEKTNKLPVPHHKEVVMHYKERGTSETAANANHNPAQKKQNHSKGAKCKKTNELDIVDLKTKGTRGKVVDKMPLDIPATVQPKAMQNCLQEQEKVGRCTETQTAHTVDEDGDVPLLLRSAEVEKTDAEEEVAQENDRIKPRLTSSQSAEKNTQISQKKSASNRQMGKRKRLKPGSWLLRGREERTDECSSNEIHSSVANRRRKQNKTRPELILSPDAEEEVAQENDRIQPRLTSSQSAGKKTQISKKKFASNRRIQSLKKIVSEVSSPPEGSEEGKVDEGGEDHAYSYPSLDPDQHHASTPNETQKQSKAKQLRRCFKEIREKPVDLKNGGVGTPLSICENEAQLECHEVGKRKRLNPGSWWLLGREKQTDECSNNEIHSSVANRRRKQNKTRPELILSPDAEEEVAQENDRIQPRLTSSQSAGKKTQISKKKSASNRRIQSLKKIVSEVSSPPEGSEEGQVDEGGEDHAYSYPSPDPDQHHASTPNETQKLSKTKRFRRCPKKIRENPENLKNGGVGTLRNICENETQLERHEVGKRKRLKPGSWWLLGREKQTDECSNNEIHSSVANRRRKQNKTRPELILSPDGEEEVGQENDRIQPRLTSSQSAGKKTQISKKKSASNRRIQSLKKIVSEVSSPPEGSEEGKVDEDGEDHAYSYPSPDPGQRHAPTPRSERVFQEVYTRPKQDRRPNKLRLSSHQSYAQSPMKAKGQKEVPYNWLEYGESEAFVECSPQLHHHPETQVLPKPRKGFKSSKTASKESAKIRSSANPQDKFLQTFSKRNHLHALRNMRASLGAIFTPVGAKTTQTARDCASKQTAGLTKTIFPSQGDQYVSSKCSSDVYEYRQNGSDYPASCPTAKTHSRAMHGKRHSGTRLSVDSTRLHQFVELQSEVDASNSIKSGPSSMLDVEEKSVPSWQNVLSECQMCGSPLKPITLQMEDRENLVIWLKNVWPSPAGGPIITPEHFQWYGYRGRAMGYRTDLQFETFSNGKILLGSYMNKPMQVDTSAISVYNILTSSVCVTISGVEAVLSSGETFVVPRGHAHGMRNLTTEPAVLLYHRMVAESSDIWE